MPTGSFLCPLATGVLSVGLQQAGFVVLSAVLFVVAAIAWLGCAVAVVTRWVIERNALRTDLADPGAAFGLFGAAAGLGVLGIRSALVGDRPLPVALLAVALGLWLVLGYLVPGSVLRAAHGRDLTDKVDSHWLQWTVSGQVVAVLATVLHGSATGLRADLLAIVAVLTWTVGLGWALLLGPVLVLRLLRQGVTARELSPAVWLVVAAVALSALAASELATLTGSATGAAVGALAAALAPILWTTAVWAVLPLLVLGWLRHAVQGVAFRHETALWAIVLALGAVAVSGIRLGAVNGLPVIAWAGNTLLWAAAGAWLVVVTAGAVQALAGIGRSGAAQTVRG